jgi:hypothetical protein
MTYVYNWLKTDDVVDEDDDDDNNESDNSICYSIRFIIHTSTCT